MDLFDQYPLVCANPFLVRLFNGKLFKNDIVRSIHSFRLFLERLFKSSTTQRRSRHCSMDTVSEFHAEVPQATASEGLFQGSYVAASSGFEPATLRTKGDESTNGPPRPTCVLLCVDL